MYTETSSFRFNSIVVQPGDTLEWTADDVCPTCHGKITTRQVDVLKHIFIDYNSGFADMGDIMMLITERGMRIIGDSENGFGIANVIPKSKIDTDK